MRQWTTRWFGIATAFILAGCGGVSEERFNALEAQLNKMQTNSAESGESAPKADALEQRLAAFEESTTESLKKMEEMMEFFQREVSKNANPQAASAPAATAGDPWTDAAVVLGIQESGVKADGDNYEVNAKWLLHQLHATAATGGKGPKFSAGKKGGVMVRGFRPGSLFDQLGLKNNDLIMEANDTPVASAGELMAALQQGKNPTTLKVQRRQKDLTLTYTIAN